MDKQSSGTTLEIDNKNPTEWDDLKRKEQVLEEQKRLEEKKKLELEEAEALAKKQKEAEAEKEREAKNEDEHEEILETEDKEAERRRVFAKSRRLIDRLSERDHSEIDAIETIQLIVAERILWLGAKLFGVGEAMDVDVHSIRNQFDFLSDLADKLVNPENESTPEVEEVYQKIIETMSEPEVEGHPETGEYSHTESESDQVMTALEYALDSSSSNRARGNPVSTNGGESKPGGEHPADRSTSIAFAITSLAAACRHSRHAHSASGGEDARTEDVSDSDPGSGRRPLAAAAQTAPKSRVHASPDGRSHHSAGSEDIPDDPADTATISTTAFAPTIPASTPNSSASRQVVTASVPASLPNTAIPPSVSIERDGGAKKEAMLEPPIQPLVESFSGPRSREPSRRLETPLPVSEVPQVVPSRLAPERKTPAPVATRFDISRQSSRVVLPSTATQSTVEKDTPAAMRVNSKARSEPPRQADEKKPPIESWPIGELLREAEQVPLGHGRYLRDAFEHGEIDKDGLVKVVKDWKKNLSYMPTFERQRASLARLRTESPEFLPDDSKRYRDSVVTPAAASDDENRRETMPSSNASESLSDIPRVANQTQASHAEPIPEPAGDNVDTKGLQHLIMGVGTVLAAALVLLLWRYFM